LNNTYTPEQQKEMLVVAANSISFGLENHRQPDIDVHLYPAYMREQRATFVTLEIHGRLRGCIGSLIAYRPLVADVSSNAFSAAFNDPRFNPLSETEYDKLDVHISVLSPPQDIEFDSEQSLLDQITPGIDGLIISDGSYRATYLPSVWEALPDKQLFLSELKQKAGLGKNYWSNTLEAQKYTTFSFGDTIENIQKNALGTV